MDNDKLPNKTRKLILKGFRQIEENSIAIFSLNQAKRFVRNIPKSNYGDKFHPAPNSQREKDFQSKNEIIPQFEMCKDSELLPEIPEELSIQFCLADMDVPYDQEVSVSFPPRDTWDIGMSDEFIRSLSKSDKKLMGRILEAMTQICKTPMAPKGDTIKPLVSNLKGLWRYRIGDFRLINKPEVDQKRVILLAFENRSDVY